MAKTFRAGWWPGFVIYSILLVGFVTQRVEGGGCSGGGGRGERLFGRRALVVRQARGAVRWGGRERERKRESIRAVLGGREGGREKFLGNQIAD
jgi:hypothetical protein